MTISNSYSKLLVFTAITLSLLPFTAIALPLECEGWESRNPLWLWCDDFEDDNLLETNYYEVKRQNGALGVDNGAAFGGSSALRATYTSGVSEHGNVKIAIGRTPMKPGINPDVKYDELYWRFYLMMGPNWEGNGNKLSRAVVFAAPWVTAAFGHIWQNDGLGISIDPATTVVGNEVTGTSYNDWDKLNWMGAKSNALTPIFAPENRGHWFCIEAQLKLNTPNQADGEFKLWIDDRLEAQLDSLNLRGGYTEYGINSIHLENYKGGGSEHTQSRYFDNFVVSQRRIGCYAGASQALPSPPTNLNAVSEQP